MAKDKPRVEKIPEYEYSVIKHQVYFSSGEDVQKLCNYLLLINRYDKNLLCGDLKERVPGTFLLQLKWWVKDEIVKDIEEAIEILWPDA